MGWGEHSQPGMAYCQERGWRGERAVLNPNSPGCLIWDEKPLGAAAFSEEIWSVPGLPKNRGQVCTVEEGGACQRSESKFMGQNLPGHLLGCQRSGLPESEVCAGLRHQVPRVRKLLEQLELRRTGWTLQVGIGRGSGGQLGGEERVSLS